MQNSACEITWSPSLNSPAKPRVLIVEDEFFIARLYVQYLREIDVEVIGPVSRLSLALEIARNEQIDMAILDIQIIGGASFPIAQALVDRDIPVVFITGYSDTVEVPDSLQGVARFGKPVTEEQFFQLVTDALGDSVSMA
jgi:two-component SAPR family response regulator